MLFLHLYYSRGGMSLDSSVSPILATNFLKHNDPSLCCTYICNRGGLSLYSNLYFFQSKFSQNKQGSFIVLYLHL